MLGKILVAIGQPPGSEAVFQAALTLAEKFGAEISILHVLAILPHSYETFGSSAIGGAYLPSDLLGFEQFQQEFKTQQQLGTERLQAYAKKAEARHLQADIFLELGDSGSIICELAKKCAADLIVVGRHQKSVISEILLGSTSNYVIHHAPCSVMVIQQHENIEKEDL